MKSILIICFNNLHNDPRIIRQVNWSKKEYNVTTLGYSSTGIEGIAHVDYVPYHNSNLMVKAERMFRFFSKNFEIYYWNEALLNLRKQLESNHYDVIVANDIDTLPLAVALGRGKSKIVFDAHEYSPLEWEDSFKWRILKKPLVEYICRTYIPEVSVATTVCQGIANLYEKNYHKQFDIVTNASEFKDFQPSPINPDKIRIIYHGNAFPSRKTEVQIEMMRSIDQRFELNLMLLGDEDYIAKLRTMAGEFKNVKFLPPVKFEEIISRTNEFDIGLFLLPPTNVNYNYALPNKLFEYVQARLAIAVSPSIEMKSLVERFSLGIVADDFSPESMAQAINNLTVEKIKYFKQQSHNNAYGLSSESNKQIFLQLLND